LKGYFLFYNIINKIKGKKMDNKIDVVSLQLFTLILVGVITNIVLIYTYFSMD